MTLARDDGRGYALGLNFEKPGKRRAARERYEQVAPKAVHYVPTQKEEAERAAKLRLYLETTPSGERDVTPQLDAMERKRGTWLREVLDCCED